ncbi:carotenoid 1,2-hydratase [Variovorax sp. GT1P44]|uniref:carotenoid 1,2-hydratase n=1 Tax=Variovorax sp. GT1P44 TaxID=3443742 RepID=UPI003F461FBF
MTERSRRSVQRDNASLRIGPSAMRWDADALIIDIDEMCVPFPSRLRGQVRLHPLALTHTEFSLDPSGRHHWRPIAPCARVEVSLSEPALVWRGAGYFDSNAGDVPLEADFVRWDWSRATAADGSTVVLYDVERHGEAPLALAFRFDPSGSSERCRDLPACVPMPPSAWRIERRTRCDSGVTPVVRRTLEDAPFYVRSLFATRLFGEPMTGVHESLSMDRFVTPWCQWMLPFRMPRRN